MAFDPFGDYETLGYLRNTLGLKNTSDLRQIEHGTFIANAELAAEKLSGCDQIKYTDILEVHATLFKDLYPWAGSDRTVTAPDLDISRGGMKGMFARPSDIRRAADFALLLASDVGTMRHKPGEIMGLLKHAHPFLDGNGRTLMLVHDDLCRRADFHIDWGRTVKAGYMNALTEELYDPQGKHLDQYLTPFKMNGALQFRHSTALLMALPGLK